MAVTSATFATTKFLFDTYNCTVDSGAGKGNFSLVQEVLRVHGDTRTCDGTCLRAWVATCRAKVRLSIFVGK